MKPLERLLVAMTPLAGTLWVRSRRRKYRRAGREVTPAERAALEPFFSADLLTSVRVCVVPRIDAPIIGGVATRLGLGSLVDLSWVRAMAFDDAVVVVQSEPSLSLLFHELVHVVQYHVFGVGPMLRRYVSDYFETGRDYFQITAEQCAYSLQARFDEAPSAPFSVALEVEQWFATAGGMS